jgi:hypothetical protein
MAAGESRRTMEPAVASKGYREKICYIPNGD